MDFKKTGYYLKKGVGYIPRIIPGVGLVSLGIRDWKTRRYNPFPYYNFRKKEDWKVIGKYAIQVGWLAFAVLKAGVTYKGVENLINKSDDSKPKTEQVNRDSDKKENNLERALDYDKLFIK
jgi:hypothetical protein